MFLNYLQTIDFVKKNQGCFVLICYTVEVPFEVWIDLDWVELHIFLSTPELVLNYNYNHIVVLNTFSETSPLTVFIVPEILKDENVFTRLPSERRVIYL